MFSLYFKLYGFHKKFDQLTKEEFEDFSRNIEELRAVCEWMEDEVGKKKVLDETKKV